MKTRFILLSISILLGVLSVNAQIIDNLIVEKYYISDLADSEDAFSAGLNESDTTFRVFVNLCDGCKLVGMFGNQNHLFEIASTEPFYNNELGRAFAHQIAPNFLNISTIGIDSYLSIGSGSSENLAILKENDPNGTIWPNGTSTGLLVNDDPTIGFPLTERDGLSELPDTLTSMVPPGFTVQPQEQQANQYVNAVFGTESDSSLFTSAYFDSLTISGNQGIFGSDAENNILLGQFTTAGELSFQFNLIVFVPGVGRVRVVADENNLQPGEVVSAFLKYPPECGCTDPDYLEFSPAAPCDDGSCQTLIQFGCTDTLACNFNEDANFNVQSLCCYGVDDCGELDPFIVCPSLSTEFENAEKLNIYPNPANRIINIENPGNSSLTEILIYSSNGELALKSRLKKTQLTELDISNLPNGLYQVVLLSEESLISRKIIVQR